MREFPRGTAIYRFALGFASIIFATASAWATSLLPGDILVSSTTNLSDGTIREFTPTGLLIQTFPVPTPGDIYPRDIAVDALERINIWNGTFNPFLTTLTPGLLPGAGSSLSHTLAGWSTVNVSYFGGIAVSGNFAYVTDMFTFSGGEANGIIRFDLTTFATQRFAQGGANTNGDYIDLNIGLDGLLYAIYPGGSPAGNMLDVFNPQTLELIRTVNLGMSLGAIAVDQSGNIFATSAFDSRIFRFDSRGMLTGSLSTGNFRLFDLDLAPDGRVLTVSSTGTVILSDTSLTSLTSFNAGPGFTFFVSFVPAPVPEPMPSVLVILGLGTGMFLWRRRQNG